MRGQPRLYDKLFKSYGCLSEYVKSADVAIKSADVSKIMTSWGKL